METIVDQLKAHCEKRQQIAWYRYSRIILRYDAPRPGDVESLEDIMKILRIDLKQLEADVHVIQQYRTYEEIGDKPKPRTPIQGCRKDADEIRRKNKRLFVALEDSHSLTPEQVAAIQADAI